MKIYIRQIIFLCCLLAVCKSDSNEEMRCYYGERGSLTAICVNAASDYFKRTPYRFDHLDETLICQTCQIGVIESTAFDISGNHLQVLNLTESGVTGISAKAFVGLIFLEKLLLSRNKINFITPGAFAGMRKLKYLYLDHAIVGQLQDNVFLELHQLLSLNLSNNNLSELSDGTFNGLLSLFHLDLSRNKLGYLGDNCLQYLTNLQVLNLENNELTAISGNEFKALSNLVVLTLGNNRISDVTINMQADNQLSLLDLSHNRIKGDKAVKKQMFQDLPHLNSLDLSYNEFKVIPAKFFQGLYNVRLLNLAYNHIEKFQTGSFSGLPQLRDLKLSHNNISAAKITGRLSLHDLHTLDLSHNNIDNIDYLAFIQRMPKISKIDLSLNKLTCDVARNLQVFFAEDNVKLVLDEHLQHCTNVTSNTGDVATSDAILRALDDSIEAVHRRNSGPEIAMIVMLVILIISVCALFYVQFNLINKYVRM